MPRILVLCSYPTSGVGDTLSGDRHRTRSICSTAVRGFSIKVLNWTMTRGLTVDSTLVPRGDR